MLKSLLILLVFQLLGEGIRSAFGLIFPGPLFGMILLLAWLCLRGEVPESLSAVSSVLVANLGIFFVPAGAGIIAYGAVLVTDGPSILVSLIASTMLAILAGGIVAVALSRPWRVSAKTCKTLTEVSSV